MSAVAASFHVPADAAGYERGASLLRDTLAGWSIAGRVKYQAELIFEEIVLNVIRHAYGWDGRRVIDVALSRAADHLTLVFDDDGPAFDPLNAPPPMSPTSLLDAPDGGRGLLLVRKIARRAEYQRTERGRNRLTVELDGAAFR